MSTHAGSAAHALTQMALGERRYSETTLASYASDMRVASVPRSRRPRALDGREFQASLFTAVSAGSAADVRYLLCIERTL